MNHLRTPLEALQFAVDFAQTDLSQTSAAQRKAIRARLEQFLVLSDSHPAPGRDPRWNYSASGHAWRVLHAAATPELVLGDVQSDLLHLLRVIAAGGSTAVDLTLTFHLFRFFDEGEQVTVGVSGERRDRVLYRAIRLLGQLGAAKLRTCADPTCGRLFFKVTRKEYCSTACQSRVYMRRWRLENPGRKTR